MFKKNQEETIGGITSHERKMVAHGILLYSHKQLSVTTLFLGLTKVMLY